MKLAVDGARGAARENTIWMRALARNGRELTRDIGSQICGCLARGDDYASAARRLGAVLDQNYRRSLCILHTEYHCADQAGQLDGALESSRALKEAGLGMTKTWHTVQDGRVRRATGKRKVDHSRLEGVTIPVEELFDLGYGVKTPAPGQSGDAANDINCRCYLSFEVVGPPEGERYDVLDKRFPQKTPEERALKERMEEDVSVIPEKHRQLVKNGVEEVSIVEEPSGYLPGVKKLYINKGFGKGQMVHEFGHILTHELKLFDDPAFLAVLGRGLDNVRGENIILDDSFEMPIVRLEHPKFVSEYQGRIYPGEEGVKAGKDFDLRGLKDYFAEGYRTYFYEPELLQQKDPELFQYIKELVERDG